MLIKLQPEFPSDSVLYDSLSLDIERLSLNQITVRYGGLAFP